ncbi:MAG: hypothetical protein IJS13_04270 [Paludibacteraceae bacterium]|nr:hypothetical protein [Paludibacteraceae bacterium]
MTEPSHNKSKRLPRRHKVMMSLNDSEYNVLQRCCARYNVRNRSRLIREILMKNLLQQFEKDSPTLFD